jgi:transcriptional regulator with XRE-family HTH domain
MTTREELLRSPEYWFEEAQNELYRQVVDFMENEGLNQTQLAERLGVSKGYISQVLRGDFNYTLKKLIELSLAMGKVPRIKYQAVDRIVVKDHKVK